MNLAALPPGLPEFTKLSMAFAYGKDSQALKDNRIAGVQVRDVAGALKGVLQGRPKAHQHSSTVQHLGARTGTRSLLSLSVFVDVIVPSWIQSMTSIISTIWIETVGWLVGWEQWLLLDLLQVEQKLDPEFCWDSQVREVDPYVVT